MGNQTQSDPDSFQNWLSKFDVPRTWGTVLLYFYLNYVGIVLSYFHFEQFWSAGRLYPLRETECAILFHEPLYRTLTEPDTVYFASSNPVSLDNIETLPIGKCFMLFPAFQTPVPEFAR